MIKLICILYHILDIFIMMWFFFIYHFWVFYSDLSFACPCFALLLIVLHVFNISTSLWIFVTFLFLSHIVDILYMINVSSFVSYLPFWYFIQIHFECVLMITFLQIWLLSLASSFVFIIICWTNLIVLWNHFMLSRYGSSFPYLLAYIDVFILLLNILVSVYLAFKYSLDCSILLCTISILLFI